MSFNGSSAQTAPSQDIEINTYLDFEKYTLEDFENVNLEDIKGPLCKEIVDIAFKVFNEYEEEYYQERVKRLKGIISS